MNLDQANRLISALQKDARLSLNSPKRQYIDKASVVLYMHNNCPHLHKEWHENDEYRSVSDLFKGKGVQTVVYNNKTHFAKARIDILETQLEVEADKKQKAFDLFMQQQQRVFDDLYDSGKLQIKAD